MLGSRKNSFTLIELLIVIFILGILASLISSNFITSLKKGRDARRKADLEEIQRALEMYYEDQKYYPKFDIFSSNNYSLCQTKIALNCETDNEKTYMQKIPNDPISGKTYEYQFDSNGSYYRLFACLENNQQILPYSNLVVTPTISCSTRCKNNQGNEVTCIWAISSPNVNP